MTCIHIETQTYAIRYEGGAYQGTQNVQPIAVGRLKSGTKVLVCRNHLTGELKTLEWSKVSNARRVSNRTITVERPHAYLSKLGTITQEGVPMEWLPYTQMPEERIKGVDPHTMAVDTEPYSLVLFQ